MSAIGSRIAASKTATDQSLKLIINLQMVVCLRHWKDNLLSSITYLVNEAL